MKIKKQVKLTVEIESGPETINFSISPVGENGILIESDVPKVVVDRKVLDEMLFEAQCFRNWQMGEGEYKDLKKEEKKQGEIVNLHPEIE